ncbi:MAG: hypothetical protein K2J00_07635 [Bacteroidaceae bacterium]|nr:hypothetical protein [Bacteroidaceae bacterium]
MHRFLPIVLAGLLFGTGIMTSCRQTGKDNQDEIFCDKDSATLKVAILPIRECDVLRYAQESGLAEQMGLRLEVIPFDATMDIDTAILSETAHVYFCDSLRIQRIENDSLRPDALLHVPVKAMLIANKDKNIENVAGLHTHMVGLTRWSQLEQWAEEMSDTVSETNIYHAQINSIPLRYRMVYDGLIDAAIIPQPWADSLTDTGHRLLEERILYGMGFFTSPHIRNDSLRQKQAQLLKKVYTEALGQQTD